MATALLDTISDKLFGKSRYATLALLVSVCQVVFITALEAMIFMKHRIEVHSIEEALETMKKTEDPAYQRVAANARSISVYHILFIVTQVFQLVLCIDALINQNTIQIIALTIFIWGMLAYSVIQVYQTATLIGDDEPVGNAILNVKGFKNAEGIPYEIAVIGLMLLFAVTFAFIAYKLYQDFGWRIYKKIGADMDMRDRYKMYQIFIMLLKFDVFFFLGFSVQFLVLVIIIQQGDWKLHITMSLLASITLLVIAYWAVRTENKIMMYGFMLGAVGTLVYIVLKIVDVAEKPDKYLGTRIFVTFFLCVCLTLDLITFGIAIVCLRNFDQGLKFHLTRTNLGASELNVPGQGYNLDQVNNRKRWSID